MKSTEKTTLAIISRSKTGWHVGAIAKAAKAKGLDVNIVNMTSNQSLGQQLDSAGDVILWRASSLDHQSERPSLLPYISNKIMVNETLFHYPMAAYKYFQQNIMLGTPVTKKFAIPTFRAKTPSALRALAKSDLRFPFIAKPNRGSQGDGIELIRDEAALRDFGARASLSDYIFQNFIENDGDWRVIVLGGRPLGTIKRIAKAGSHLNNISQGATAQLEEDEKVKATIYDIALKAASVFKLRFCGIDIIRDQKTGEFYILEVNTAPQWDGEFGFQSMTGVNVGEQFADYALAMDRRRQGDPAIDMIEDYYKQTVGYDESTEFHFASRLWLWTHDDWARTTLDRHEASYIGTDPEAIRHTLKQILKRSKSEAVSVNEKSKYRKPYYDKYPKLSAYDALLFKVIFCDSVYGIDIRSYVSELVSDADFITLFNELISDHDAIRVLSTHAANYFYLLKNYFKDTLKLSSAVLVDPHEILTISRDYDKLIESNVLKPADATKLRIYLLTHAIIGESRFYQQPVKGTDFKALIKELESVIRDNYSTVSLDNKCEFLVCAKLCGYRSMLESIILGEAGRSLSWAGNFIVDSQNANAGKGSQSLRLAEHRNVLYLMAQKDFIAFKPRRIAKAKPATEQPGKQTLGRLARLDLPDLNVRHMIARVDTGATSSSLHASDIREENGTLVFKFVDPQNPLWTGKDFTVTKYKKLTVRNASGDADRYAAELTVNLDGFTKKVLFTLTDRQSMLYPVLLGRNFIKRDFIVDIDRQFQTRSKV